MAKSQRNKCKVNFKGVIISKQYEIAESTIVTGTVLKSARKFLEDRGFVEILPLILTKLSDPLMALQYATTEITGRKYLLTTSMIFQKQILMNYFDRIFIFSPNVRIEKQTPHHLIEFVQLDIEVKNAAREEMLDFIEDLVIYLVKKVKEAHPDLVKVQKPSKPFKRITVREMKQSYGDMLSFSNSIGELHFLIDFPEEEREFYDREDPENKGILLDYDLIYPEGFGEALSGGERECEYEQIIQRIKRKGISLKNFKEYLEYAKEGKIMPSAGFGIGVERFVRYILKLSDIKKTRIFVYLS